MSQERTQDDISKNTPTILEENEEKESAFSTKCGPDLEDTDLAHDGDLERRQIATHRRKAKIYRSRKLTRRRFRYSEGWDVEIPPGTEMQDSSVNMAHRTRISEKEVAVLQSLAILERLVLNNATERIVKNEDLLIVHGQAVSQIEETNRTKWSRMAFSENCTEVGNGGNF